MRALVGFPRLKHTVGRSRKTYGGLRSDQCVTSVRGTPFLPTTICYGYVGLQAPRPKESLLLVRRQGSIHPKVDAYIYCLLQ